MLPAHPHPTQPERMTMRLYIDIEADSIDSQDHFYKIVNEACEQLFAAGVGDTWEVVRVGYMSTKPIRTRSGKTWAKNEEYRRRTSQAAEPAPVV